ncbi:hypothetical protein [Mesorhizobium sp.]|uniref:hypothetical protein n=1 Tax=Mesorhizobium sp. TaxID=1871066 RepID=UPI000FE513AD|nr:hypothetical protein [Mesorhizobium sp.]RWF86821.1 MAG: hypothetical protein EOQ36_15575 [Mesorhizobium sp.]RWF90790.1 MAG: hypothetical protein EOQ45_28555 [Mesorhizobium sp.]RWJ56950.1 MAG: hypothetical protein EOR32_32595 [Mesorhizobium sp.]RWJ63146.1 MAG: hypothetical protein EOR34_32945 [Mesorhizobium sp.]RWJ92568.1 MAG: hypothetical protein EOR38_32595 [Mesorhizobium sp.]
MQWIGVSVVTSAERRIEYDDLMPLTRRLMPSMQEDLGTKIDRVAADHFNIGHPQSQVIVRGKVDRDENVVTHAIYLVTGGRPSWSGSISVHARDPGSTVPGNGNRNASAA